MTGRDHEGADTADQALPGLPVGDLAPSLARSGGGLAGLGQPPVGAGGSEVGPGAERWGWEHRGRVAEVPPPPRVLPVLDVPNPVALAKLESEGERSGRRRSTLTWLTGAGAAVTVTTAALVDPAVIAIVPGVFTATTAWLRGTARQRFRTAVTRAYSSWTAEYDAADHAYAGELNEWWTEQAEQARSETARVDAIAQRVPLGPTSTERVDVFGGSPNGWRKLLTTVGGSVLGRGGRMVIVDLTQDAVADPLLQMAGENRISTASMTLSPDSTTDINLLSGLSPAEIGDLLAEAFHADRPGSPDTRRLDTGLIRQIAEHTREAPVTCARLLAALRVVQRDAGPQQPTELTRSEYRALSDLLGETVQRNAGGRLGELASFVHRLPSSDVDGAALWRDDVSLRIVRTSGGKRSLADSPLRQVLFQLTLRDLHSSRIRETAGGELILVVAGAESVPREHLAELSRVARRQGVRLVLMFAHLREDGAALLGGGGAVVFMRLGNAGEAESAAKHIGKQHKLVASGHTFAKGGTESVTRTMGTTEGWTETTTTTTGRQSTETGRYEARVLYGSVYVYGSSSSGKNWSTGTSKGKTTSTTSTVAVQTGTTMTETVNYHRSYEFAVEPSLLQRLPETAFVLVDPLDASTPRLGDCDLDPNGAGSDSAV